MTRNDVGAAARQLVPPKKQLSDLYLEDETAWLELMSQLVKERRFDQMDVKNLSEYLNDMAIRDKREVLSRLATLMAHRLKWDHQPNRRSRSWELTIMVQRLELEDLLESRTLRNHAQIVLPKAYARAILLAMKQTSLGRNRFPVDCPYTLDDVLSKEWKKQDD